MNRAAYLIVKLAAAGDVLLTTALARALRRARPTATLAWMTSAYAAELLEGNPDIDEILTGPVPVGGGAARLRAAAAWRPRLRAWRRQHPGAQVLLGHRSRALAALLGAAGFRRIVSLRPAHPGLHRLQQQRDLLAAAGIAVPIGDLEPRLCLSAIELRNGDAEWAGCAGPRWAIAPGGADNPWSAMPNRRWGSDRFAELGRRATAAGMALRWLGGPADGPLVDAIVDAIESNPAHNCAGRLSLRQTAAVGAAADLVIGNDSLALVMAHALGRPALGLYGPTAGAAIHAPGQPWVQGRAGCGPCYDSRAGTRGQAYRCARARCMEQIEVEQVWWLATRAQEAVHG